MLESNFRSHELIVLGNGFDLSVGLKSSYDDFLTYKLGNLDNPEENIATEILAKNEDQFLKAAKEYINSLLNEIWQLPFIPLKINDDMFAEYRKNLTFNPLTKEQFYEKYQVLQKYNSFINSLRNNGWSFWEINLLITYAQDLNWRDVEQKIADLVQINRNPRTGEKIGSFRTDVLKSKINGIVQVSASDKNRSDKLLAIIVFQNQIPNTKKGIEISEYSELAIEFNNLLDTDLKKFEESFKYYIYNISSEESYQNNKDDMLTKLAGGSFVGGTFNLLNFNYTVPYIKGNAKKIEINVHGVADASSREIHFGVDNNMIEPEEPGYIFTKAYKTMIVRDPSKQVIPLDNGSIDQIKFFGHSLGKADYGYFYKIFDEVDILNRHVNLKFYYKIYDRALEKQIISRQKISIAKLLESYAIEKEGKLVGKTIINQLGERLQLLNIDNIRLFDQQDAK